MPENNYMVEKESPVECMEEDKKKKSKKKKGQTWAKEGPKDPFELLNSLPEEKQQEIQKALHLFSVGQGAPKNLKEALGHKYQFWDTQPVPKIDEEVTSQGSIESERSGVREEPYSLPQDFIWDTLDLENQEQVRELCDFLNENYTEEDDNTIRLHYSPQFLLWALCPTGWQSQWHCGVRVNSSHKLVGFISAVPATVQIFDTELKMVEVNFLCVHKKLRFKRVTPVLIKEITRRVHKQGIFQAIYAASAVLPKPIANPMGEEKRAGGGSGAHWVLSTPKALTLESPLANPRSWHRSLNPRKLIELNFSSLTSNTTLQRAIRLNRLPQTTKTPGLRPMIEQDVHVVHDLLRKHLKTFHLSPVLSQEDVQHWFLPRDSVIDTYVVESLDGVITDMVSFYTQLSTVLNHPVHKSLKAACALYCISKSTPIQQLMEDILIICKARGFDVFFAPDVMDNKAFFESLKFRMGDESKQYYFYNWRCPEIASEKVGIVLK